MALVVTDGKHYKAIADALRLRGYMPHDKKWKPEDMAGAVKTACITCENKGYDIGYNCGYHDSTGYEHGYDHGFNEGYDEGWDEFFHLAQDYGNQIGYRYFFAGGGWTINTFKPIYDMQPIRAEGMFYMSRITGDLVEILNNLGVTLDFSRVPSMMNCFENSRFTRVGVIDCRNATRLDKTFARQPVLTTIDKLILKEDGSNALANTFFETYELRNITIEGKIGYRYTSFADCTQLTHDSLMSILNALYDYSESEKTYTLTLGATNLAKLTAAEKAIATQKGWSLA